jgi:hypothetical protein
MKTYTQKEIDSAINVLTTELDNLMLDRKNINELIRKKKKNIEYYKEMDLGQYKIL